MDGWYRGATDILGQVRIGKIVTIVGPAISVFVRSERRLHAYFFLNHRCAFGKILERCLLGPLHFRFELLDGAHKINVHLELYRRKTPTANSDGWDAAKC